MLRLNALCATHCAHLWHTNSEYMRMGPARLRGGPRHAIDVTSMGYCFERVHQSRAKAIERRVLNIPVKVRVVLVDGKPYAQGKAVITKLTAEGAELGDLKIEPQSIPVLPCYLQLDFTVAGRDMHLRGDIKDLYLVRFPRIGVKFVEMLESDALHIARHAARLRAGSE